MPNYNKVENLALGVGAGIVIGYVGVELVNFITEMLGSNSLSFATVDCAGACSRGDCQTYNCSGACTAGCSACGGAAAIGQNCGGGGTPTSSPPPSGGGSDSGKRWSQAAGSVAKLSNVRCNKTKCGVDTGSGSGGNRWETVKSGWMGKGFEVVMYTTVKKGSMCNGGHIGLKHGGPQHKQCKSGDKISCGNCHSSCSGKGCCCWWDSGIRDNGDVYLEIEYPHACNFNTKHFGNIGQHIDTGKPLGVRWLIKKEGGGVRLRLWVDTSGTVNGYNWRKMYDVLDTGQFMKSGYLSKIRNEQNIEIRMSDVNCSDIKMHNAEARKI